MKNSPTGMRTSFKPREFLRISLGDEAVGPTSCRFWTAGARNRCTSQPISKGERMTAIAIHSLLRRDGDFRRDACPPGETDGTAEAMGIAKGGGDGRTTCPAGTVAWATGGVRAARS